MVRERYIAMAATMLSKPSTGGQVMTTLFLLLSTLIYLLAKVNTHDALTQTTKSKGNDAHTSQPFKH